MPNKTVEDSVIFVNVKGKTYLLREDVVRLILDIAATEDTDVNNRLTYFARSLLKVER